MERRVWRVEVEGKQHVVEYKVKTAGEGEVLVDGKIVDSWRASPWGLPKERSFPIGVGGHMSIQMLYPWHIFQRISLEPHSLRTALVLS